MLLAAACMLVAAHGFAAQTNAGAAATPPQTTDAATKLPAFEVATIKPNKGDTERFGVGFTPDGISITGLTLHMLIREAFGVSNDRLLGEPGWVDSARYDIEAKVDAADAPKLDKVKLEQRWAMLLPLLEDRFGLKFHHETKEKTEYFLVVTKGGPKLKPSKVATPGDKRSPRTAIWMSTKGISAEANNASMESIVRMLSLQLGSTIVDKTGLTGTYDYRLDWTPDDTSGPMTRPGPGGGPPKAGGAAPPEPSGPSLFTALQEQLGLKLESHKGPVDVIVIDHIQPPSPN
jgi:bla regulator protein blaR1